MLCTTDVQIHVTPIFINLPVNKGIVVVRIHVAQIVSAGSGEARHGAGFERIAIVSPIFCPCERRFSALCRLELGDLRERERQFLKRNRSRDAVLVVDRERLTPVPLAAEDRVTETVVDLPVAKALFLNIFNGSRDGLLDIQSVKESGIDHLAFLRVKAFLADIAALYQRNDRQVELLRERIVAAIVGRNSHDGACAITSENIFRDPDRDSVAGHRVHSVGAAEHARYGLGLGDPLALGLFLNCSKIFIHSLFLLRSCQKRHQIALRCQHHECHAEHRVSAGCEYGHVVLRLTIVALEHGLAAV